MVLQVFAVLSTLLNDTAAAGFFLFNLTKTEKLNRASMVMRTTATKL